MLRVALLVLAAVGASVLLGRGGAAEGASACTAGVRTVGGATVRTFCGPASATAKAGGRTFHFSGGTCAVEQGYLTVNIGAITLPPAKPKLAYLGIDVKPPKAGAHANQIVSWQVPGKRYSLLPGRVVVQAGLKGGSFSGPVLGGGGAGSGTFTCG